jgi:hypothetical protein
VNEQDNDRDEKQQVNESLGSLEENEPQEPQDEDDDCYCQHDDLLDWLGQRTKRTALEMA